MPVEFLTDEQASVYGRFVAPPSRADLERCEVAERGMLRPSFIPPAPIRRLPDLTRYRVDLLGARGRQKHRVEKLLEDADSKLPVLASDIFGVSGRAMMDALVAGERDPPALVQPARSRMRTKLGDPRAAFVGNFGAHHAFLPARMLAHGDQVNADITAVGDRTDRGARPCRGGGGPPG